MFLHVSLHPPLALVYSYRHNQEVDFRSETLVGLPQSRRKSLTDAAPGRPEFDQQRALSYVLRQIDRFTG
jgi:hypothetical protein